MPLFSQNKSNYPSQNSKGMFEFEDEFEDEFEGLKKKVDLR